METDREEDSNGDKMHVSVSHLQGPCSRLPGLSDFLDSLLLYLPKIWLPGIESEVQLAWCVPQRETFYFYTLISFSEPDISLVKKLNQWFSLFFSCTSTWIKNKECVDMSASETTWSMTVARCCVQDRDWKSSIHSREDTEWGSMCWMVLGDVAMPKMNISGRRSM